MTPYAPTDLPRLRDTLAAFATTETGVQFRELDMDEERIPRGDPRQFAEAEAERLTLADLYYVTEDLTELVVAAAGSLPEVALAPDDVPSRHGFAYLAEPVADVEPEAGKPIHVHALGWSTVGDRVQFTTYCPRDALFVPEADLIAVGMPPLVPFGIMQVPVYPDGAPMPLHVEQPGGVVVSALKTLWLLMRQPLAETTDVALSRAVRRQYERDGREPPPVRVIALRRPPGASTGEAARDWKHRWMVRGHWRQQPYGPGRERTRPVWISPHIKGPDGAPLIGGEKVYRVSGDP
jgi:hypothetical protein